MRKARPARRRANDRHHSITIVGCHWIRPCDSRRGCGTSGVVGLIQNTPGKNGPIPVQHRNGKGASIGIAVGIGSNAKHRAYARAESGAVGWSANHWNHPGAAGEGGWVSPRYYRRAGTRLRNRSYIRRTPAQYWRRRADDCYSKSACVGVAA